MWVHVAGSSRAVTAAAVAAVVTLAAAVAAPAARAENPFHCEASALRLAVAGTPAPEPATAGRAGECDHARATPPADVPGPLQGEALFADTDFDAAAATGSAAAGLTRLSVDPGPAPPLPTQQALSQLPALSVGLPKELADAVARFGVPSSLLVDVRAAAAQLVAPPSTALITADVLSSTATVRCDRGAPALDGSSEITGLKLAGQDVPLSGPIERTLTLAGAQRLDPAALDPALVEILTPLGGVPAEQRAQIEAALGPALAQLPPLELPASVAEVRIVPREQLRDGGSLTQRALHVTISAGGQQLLDAVVGEARVSAAGGACAAVAAQSANAQILSCTDRKLVLVDVLRDGRRVKLLGAANRAYVGRRVAIRLRATGRIVAHARVRRDGSFATTAPLPPRAQMASHTRANRLRYRAEIGREKSLPLKLQRRMIVSRLSSRRGTVTIAGRVVAPLTTPASTIRLVRRVSCHRVVLVKRFKPRSDGTFSVTVKAPRNAAAAVYRMTTYVREKPGNPRRYPTFTLPRGVALNTR